MPELPDVEIYRRYLNATALHQRIDRIHVTSASILLETSPQGLGRALKHKSFHATERHGKYLFIAIDNETWLVMHLGMTGDIKYFLHEQDMPEYTRLLICFENGYHLAYTAPRKLGRIALTDSLQTWIKVQDLGPDAVAINESQFLKQAKQRRGGIKSWLMNQQIIAGIGNIYSDEILFQARIHPRHLVSDLDKTALQRIYKKMHSVLKTAIKRQADPEHMPSSWLLRHREQGGHCPTCNTPLETAKMAGRTAWYCPRCQDN